MLSTDFVLESQKAIIRALNYTDTAVIVTVVMEVFRLGFHIQLHMDRQAFGRECF